MTCKFCQHELHQVGCCGETGLPILVCHSCGSLKLCDQEQTPSPLWTLCRHVVTNDDRAAAQAWSAIKAIVAPEGGPK